MPEAKIKLERIFAIESASERQKALLEYARLLRINTLKARNDDGSFSEDLLAVLIYDVEANKQKRRFSNIGILFIAFFIFLAIIVGIFFMSLMISSSMRNKPAEGHRISTMWVGLA